MRNFLLMSSVGCHLCEQAIDILVQNMNPELHQLEEVDIAFDDALMDKYSIRIPVLVDEQSGAELGWPFDADQLHHFIQQLI
ncbi:glutaredoxin family protein [Amphritea balenae]|nr:glutaredoxin family protein [Amphritea balenae]GGK83009.1 thioredoxin family protein [Amphritea balenae]